MTDGLKMALTIGLITVLVAIGLMGAYRAKVATEESGDRTDGAVTSIMNGVNWD